nr:ATP phosphoribosyltransferase regulatory subunit [Pantoea sp. 201603H]
MTRKSRLFVDGIPHLVKLSGHNNGVIFKDENDFRSFFDCIENALTIYAIKLHAYNLSARKILLLLSAPDKERLGRFMQYLSKGYSQVFNQRHQRHGTLWDGRYSCCPVEPNAYFLLTKKYVECHCVDDLGHHSFAGEPASRVTPHDEYLRLGDSASQRLTVYQRFCLGRIGPALITRIESALTQNCLLATATYTQTLEQKYQRNLRPRKIGRPKKYEHNPLESWEWLGKKAGYLLHQYCYREIRIPLLEQQNENTGHSFSGESDALCFSHQALLRGDGTMGCLRLLSQHQSLQTETRVWYQGAMFRRQHQQNINQFHQLGVEAFGYSGIGIEIELISLQFDFFKSLQILPFIELKMNTIGSTDDFTRFRSELRQYFLPYTSLFNPQQHRWLASSPERLLTDNDILMQRLAEKAPKLDDVLSAHSHERFTKLCTSLTALNIPFIHDKNLFPINDYNDFLFEWNTDSPHNHGVLCRGGRYDNSASSLIGHPVSACGFAFMLEPIMQLLNSTQRSKGCGKQVDIVLIPEQERSRDIALLLGRKLRRNFPHLSILNDCSTLRLSTRQKNAQRQGARFIILIDGCENEATFCDETNHFWQQIPLSDVVAHLSHALMM